MGKTHKKQFQNPEVAEVQKAINNLIAFLQQERISYQRGFRATKHLHFHLMIPEFRMVVDIHRGHYFNPSYGEANYKQAQKEIAEKKTWCLLNDAHYFYVPYFKKDIGLELCQELDKLDPIH